MRPPLNRQRQPQSTTFAPKKLTIIMGDEDGEFDYMFGLGSISKFVVLTAVD